MKPIEAIQALVTSGAALSFVGKGVHGAPFVRLVAPGRIFWWSVGFSDFDHHILDFERSEVIYNGKAVQFLDKGGDLVGYLAEVDHQIEDDPERAADLKRQIQDWKKEFAGNEYFRGNVLRAGREAADA